jgi:hypothetical protein
MMQKAYQSDLPYAECAYPGPRLPAQKPDERRGCAPSARSSTRSSTLCAVAVPGDDCPTTTRRGRLVHHCFRIWRIDGTWERCDVVHIGYVRCAWAERKQQGTVG